MLEEEKSLSKIPRRKKKRKLEVYDALDSYFALYDLLKQMSVNSKLKHGKHCYLDWFGVGISTPCILSRSIFRVEDDAKNNKRFFVKRGPVVIDGETIMGGSARIWIMDLYVLV